MKKFIFLFLILAITSCTFTTEPDFLKLDDFKVITFNKNEVKLGTNAYFHNPNDVGCEVVSTDIDVFVNGLNVSKVNQVKSIHLESGNEFTIPISVNIPTNKIAKDKGGIFNGMLATLLNKNVAIQYKGTITLKKAGITFDIDIEGEEVLKKFNKLLNF